VYRIKNIGLPDTIVACKAVYFGGKFKLIKFIVLEIGEA
jgi:hypothetical protein